ncbi:hypothetical protein Hypma_002963 [Hypsizygus marmoreus]|uniref:F-box domain-containing protein n=1 Tax=Hypsizygus marmoreus TaxID=39966 RepID=A0A369J5G0_HYPMA|nr:hypothetical protein Hypma_002963 [Hypsizygus marmoreus]
MDVSTELPQEIIDKIIDNLWKDDQALKRCALASSVLRPKSQKRLFSFITLDKSQSCDRLLPLLTENPTLCTYIHDITLMIDQETDPQWLGVNKNLSCILDMLTSLRSCSLSMGNEIDWEDIHSHTTAALFRVFALPSLASIEILGLYGIPETFFDIPNVLEQLVLQSVAFTRTSDAGVISPRSLCMTTLDFHPVASAFVDQNSAAVFALTANRDSCFSHITDLRIRPSDDSLPILLPILNAAAKSLTSMELNHTYTQPELLSASALNVFQFNLANLTNLSRLSFHFTVLYTTFNNYSSTFSTSARHLTTFLASSASTLARIETLTATFTPFDVHSSYDISMVKSFTELDVWSQLDKAICPDRSSAKLRVSLVLSIEIPKLAQLVEARNLWRELMQGKFPMLEERGTLTLEVESSISNDAETE